MKGTHLISVTTDTTTSGRSIAVELTQNTDSVPVVWLAELAAGALLEMAHSDEAVASDAVDQVTAAGPGPDGARVTSDLGVGAVTLGQLFDSPIDSVLRARVDDVAQDFGLKVSDVQILQPLESAMQVTLVVPDDSKIDWTIDQLRTALVGKTPAVEGALIELDAPDGKALLLAGTAYRTGGGGLWFAPGQDERFGANHGTVGSYRG